MLWLPQPLFWYTKSLQAVSGLKLTPGQFIQVGGRCSALEQLLVDKFCKTKEERKMAKSGK